MKPEAEGAAPAAPGRYDAVVVGAGISGLAAAFRLARGGLAVAVLEASERVGGSITTLREAGFLFELGPNTVLDSRPAVGELLRDAGLAAERIVAAPAAKRRYLWKGERLVPLPSGPGSFLATSVFSPRAKLRLLREPWVGKGSPDDDESIADFVRRRLGQPFLDYAVGPFVSGVYAGDPERLSVRWAVPRIWSLEQQHGSLLRGALARRKGPAPGGAMFSFGAGLEVLPERLAAAVGGVRTGCACRGVGRDGEGFVAATDAGSFRAPHLVLAVPADAAARLLAELSGGASRPLAELVYAPVVVACYGFRRRDVAHPLDGFGFLAPRRESLRVLGCLFPSTIFPGRAPAGCVALTAFAGGRTDPEITGWDDETLDRAFLSDLDRALGLAGEPVCRRLARWPRAIPQFECGHGRFAALAKTLEERFAGLHLAGNAFSGVSVPDCIQGAAAVAERILAGG
jgi:protoporphyrinogen/coproporphyrinogen III oxidase